MPGCYAGCERDDPARASSRVLARPRVIGEDEAGEAGAARRQRARRSNRPARVAGDGRRLERWS
jgi:hypothetical protein